MILLDDRKRHLHVIGQTGTGKSTAILNFIADDLYANRGVAVFDPHGDLAEDALSQIPTARAHELVYIHPADLDRPIAYNVLENVPQDRRPAVADGVVASFKHVWPDFFGPRMEYILLNTLRALLDHQGATLLSVPRLLLDPAYRTKVVADITDPVVRSFFLNEFTTYDDKFLSEALSPILNKINRALSSPHLRNIVSQPKSTINLRRIMDEGRILIVNLSKGEMGEGNAHLLGALLITGIANAALSRSDIPEAERTPLFLYADEFQAFATESFNLILSEARKYGLALTLSHQFLSQLPEGIKSAVLGNTGSVICFRLGAEDAPLMASHLGLKNPDTLKDLSNFTAWARFLNGGNPGNPQFVTFPPKYTPLINPAKIVKNSRTRFGRDRTEVENKIERFLTWEKPKKRKKGNWG